MPCKAPVIDDIVASNSGSCIQAILAGRGPVHESEMDGEDDNEDEESPRADKGNDVVMPVDGLPLPPDSRAGMREAEWHTTICGAVFKVCCHSSECSMFTRPRRGSDAMRHVVYVHVLAENSRTSPQTKAPVVRLENCVSSARQGPGSLF